MTGAGYFQKYTFSCPAGTVFDENISVCNHPWAAPPCDENSEETEESVETENTEDTEDTDTEESVETGIVDVEEPTEEEKEESVML